MLSSGAMKRPRHEVRDLNRNAWRVSSPADDEGLDALNSNEAEEAVGGEVAAWGTHAYIDTS